MKKWLLFDYFSDKQENEIKAWGKTLQKEQRAKLDSKLDMLEKWGTDLPSGLLSDTPFTDIKKIRIKGNVAVRLFLCYGPFDMDGEFTLLLGGIEKDRKLIPKDAIKRAKERRQEVIENKNKRCRHERFGK